MSIFPFSINLSEHRRTPKIQQDMIKIYIYMQDMSKNSYINTLSNHSTCFLRNSPDESLPKAVERFVGSSGLISPLKRGLRVHLWFASPFSGTRTVAMSAPPLSVCKKWQVDWCHCVVRHIPHVCACQMCSSFTITNNMTPPHWPNNSSNWKIQWWTKRKKTQPLSSTVIKMCLSLHSSLITEHVM